MNNPQYVNIIRQRPISIREKVIATFTFKEIPSQAGNTITSCLRYDEDDSTVAAKDISTLATIATNVVTLEHIFLAAGDADYAGNFRVTIVVQDNTGLLSRQEVNYLVPVLA